MNKYTIADALVRGSKAGHEWMVVNGVAAGPGETVRIVRCDNCGLVFSDDHLDTEVRCVEFDESATNTNTIPASTVFELLVELGATPEQLLNVFGNRTELRTPEREDDV